MILLEDRSLLNLQGADVFSFLQGLVTCDVRPPEAGDLPSLYGVLLSPQGKIRFDFFLYQHADGVLMDVAHTQLEDVKKILRLYVLRSDVTITENPQLAVVASLNEKADLPADPRLSAMGFRGVLERSTLVDQPLMPLLTYHTHRIAQGVPDSTDFIPDRAFSAEYGLEQLNAISFTKGCYVGQEVVARTKHRGTVHKMLHHIALEEGGHFPETGTAIIANDKEIGQLRTHIENEALAIIRRDKLQGKENTLTVGGKKISAIRMPEWFETR